MTPEAYDVLVIGAGPAGTAGAVRAAELGARVAVAEADRTGGTCVNTGCVPTRVLARTARIMREIAVAPSSGIDVGPASLDWARAVARVRRAIEEVHGAKRTPEVLAEVGADLYGEGRARFTGPHEVELAATGRRLTARQVLLCVGGRSRLLPVPGAELAITAERVLDLDRLPGSVAIVGAGSTGVQLATVFSAFGARVSLLEAGPRLLPGADADIGGTLAEAFVKDGVEVRTGIDGVEAIEPAAGGARVVRYRDAGQPGTVEAEIVVLSVGWPAAIEGLDLDRAGVRVERGRVPVNAFLQSSVPHVYVPGDANGEAMLVQAARFEAEAAATNAVLGPTRSVPHALLPSGGFTNPDYATVGLSEEQAMAADPECHVAHVPYSSLERAIIDQRTDGFLKLIADRRRQLLLGAHAAGESAVEVIQAVTTAMAAGVDVATLARVEFAYPTYSAIVGEAAARLMREPAAHRRV